MSSVARKVGPLELVVITNANERLNMYEKTYCLALGRAHLNVSVCVGAYGFPTTKSYAARVWLA